MNKSKRCIAIAAILSLSSACSTSNTVIPETPVQTAKGSQHPRTSNPTDEKKPTEKFSYLKKLSPQKQEALIRFKSQSDMRELHNFTPEEMVLVYLYSLSIGDPGLLYDITYNGGQLPDKDQFWDEYLEYAHTYDSETAIHYRYYDSIEVEEGTAEESRVTVVIMVSLETMTHSMALGLRKEDEVWKLDIYHLIKEHIHKAKANKK
ncbi:hypothetical protein [Paenibacillus gansuensis]|uniref:Lipoprotein n=1 Tax=Paenibacillus gansuensis TaxID=306542 RepID=A0ABW5PHP4_9BACL